MLIINRDVIVTPVNRPTLPWTYCQSCNEKLLVKGNFKPILVSRSYCYLEESSVYLKSSQSILETPQVRQKTSRKSQKQPKIVLYDRTRSVSQQLYALLLMSGDRFQSRLRSLINLWMNISASAYITMVTGKQLVAIKIHINKYVQSQSNMSMIGEINKL